MAGRKFLAPLLICALLVMVASASAQMTLPENDAYESSLNTRTSVWDTSSGGDGNPVAVGEFLQEGDEQRATVNVTSVSFADLFRGEPNNTVKTQTTDPLVYQSGDLRGLLYDVDYRTLESFGPNNAPVTYWTAGGRYAAGSDWNDTYTEGSLVGDVDALAASDGYGGIAVIYDHEGYIGTGDDSWSEDGNGGGDDDWSEKTGPGTADGSLTVSDEYPSVNTATTGGSIAADPTTPWMVIALAPLPTEITSDTATYPGVQSTDVLVEENFEFASPTNDGSANGYAWGNVIGGTIADRVAPDVFGTGLDVRFDFSATFQSTTADAQGWLADAADPFGFATPEPTAASLLVLGLLGLLSVRRKNN